MSWDMSWEPLHAGVSSHSSAALGHLELELLIQVFQHRGAASWSELIKHNVNDNLMVNDFLELCLSNIYKSYRLCDLKFSNIT